MFQIPIQIYRALSLLGGVISTTTSCAMLATARHSCYGVAQSWIHVLQYNYTNCWL